MRSRTLAMVVLAGVAAVALEGSAWAKQVRYVGMHPIVADVGGGFCYIEVPHIHVYAPTKAEVLYREHDDSHFFVGDPVPYGYEGPKHAYYGAHPVPVDVIVDEHDLDGDEVEYCYLDGPHYHYYTPSAQLKFKVKGGVHFFVGDLPEAYVVAKPKYVKINAVYKPLRYERPVFVSAPPPEYHGHIVAVDVDPVIEIEPVPAEVEVVTPVPVVGVHGHISGPAVHGHVEVGVQVPSVEVHVPGVVVQERVHVIEAKPKHHKHKHKHKHKKYKHSKVKGHW